jgi:hypothetical protein
MPLVKVEGKVKIDCADVIAPEGWRSPRRFAQTGNSNFPPQRFRKDGTGLAGEEGGKIYSVKANGR